MNLPEIRDIIKGIAETPGKIFNMVRYNARESEGQYLSNLKEMLDGKIDEILRCVEKIQS